MQLLLSEIFTLVGRFEEFDGVEGCFWWSWQNLPCFSFFLVRRFEVIFGLFQDGLSRCEVWTWSWAFLIYWNSAYFRFKQSTSQGVLFTENFPLWWPRVTRYDFLGRSMKIPEASKEIFSLLILPVTKKIQAWSETRREDLLEERAFIYSGYYFRGFDYFWKDNFWINYFRWNNLPMDLILPESNTERCERKITNYWYFINLNNNLLFLSTTTNNWLKIRRIFVRSCIRW